MKTTQVISAILIAFLLVIGYCIDKAAKSERAPEKKADFSSARKFSADYELTPSNVYREIMKNEIMFSEIVLRQALHESKEKNVFFSSRNCRERNNLFGMKGGEKTSSNIFGYKIFSTWMDSVKDYKKWQVRRMPEDCSDYYKFLSACGYAEDSSYCNSLKKYAIVIIKQ